MAESKHGQWVLRIEEQCIDENEQRSKH